MKKRTLSMFCVLVLAITLVMVAVLAGCGTTKTTDEKKIVVVVIKEGKLSMGSDTTYPPFETIGDDGKPVGFDVDMATEIASRLGVELDITSVKWEGIIPGLKTGDYDMVMSAMTITPERQAEIDFSDPYIDSNQSIAVKKGNTSIKSEADLAGKVVGVQVDTTGQFTAEGIQGIKEIRKYDTILLAFEDLELGRVDAILNDYPVNAYLSRTRGNSDVVTTIKTDEQYGIGIKKGNDQLLEAINQALADMKADGSYDVIYKKWFSGV